jgi:chemotaxis family two-component system sensor kinase Cph1
MGARVVQLERSGVIGSDVDLTTCDREPIHLAGAIQPFGALVVLDGSGRLERRSRNAASLLGPLPEFGEAFGAAYHERLAPWLAAPPHEPLEPIEIAAGGRVLDVVAHRSGGRLVVEFEPREADAPAHSSFALKAQRALDRIQRQPRLDGLLDVATEELWTLTGFDRVMAYRFLHDDSGHVVAERRRPELETFLGLRYPATDIPVQARRLFALNRLRFIPDLAYRPIAIEPPSDASARDPLDLSHSMLRSVSPVHVEYLQNMGVTASMSISIVVGGRLWGLFACHHYRGARLVPHAVRTACALLAQIVSVLVERVEVEERARGVDAARALREELQRRARAADDIVAALCATPSFAGLVGASGSAALLDKRVSLLGSTPAMGVTGELSEWLRSSADDVVATHELGRVVPALAGRLDGTAGLLAVRFHREQNGWLCWFRQEEAETVRWAGNPEKTYSEGPLGPRLNPRGSFGEWVETVRGRAAPWQPHELDVATAFRRDIQEVALAKLSEFERARDMMLAALGHDLRSPLNAISMAATLLSGGSGSQSDLGARIARSSGRMQRLVDQMLDLSRIQAGLGLGVQRRSGDLAALVRHAVEESRLGFPGVELELDAPPELASEFDPDRIGQVLSNLLSNARHHGRAGRSVRIELVARDDVAILSVTNEGEPIPTEARARIFQPFKLESLNRSRNRSGLGLGLHIVNEIVKSHGGRIEILDADGLVTFRVSLPLRALEPPAR